MVKDGSSGRLKVRLKGPWNGASDNRLDKRMKGYEGEKNNGEET